MSNVLFISEQKLRDNTPISDNVQTSELRYCIQNAQTINIQETLGTKLYNKMIDLVETNDITGSTYSNYKLLLNTYIQPTTIAYSYYYGLDNFLVKFVNIGLVSNSSEQGSAIDFKTFQFIKSNAKEIAEFQDNLMRRYLCFNTALYPEYTLMDNLWELPAERGSAFKSSMVLPQTPPYPNWYGPVTPKNP